MSDRKSKNSERARASSSLPDSPEVLPGQLGFSLANGAKVVEDVRPNVRRRHQLSMLDLFSGSGSASRAAAVRGWEVLRVDNGLETAADIHADILTWKPLTPLSGKCWDLVWASPPCTLLSTANAKTRNVEKGLELVRASIRIIRALAPRWWVLENVHGATRAIGSLIGPPVARYGSFYLWGIFPPFDANVPREKTKLSGRRRAERRAAIPWPIANGLTCACEALDAELRK
jgi:hypothetical protein